LKDKKKTPTTPIVREKSNPENGKTESIGSLVYKYLKSIPRIDEITPLEKKNVHRKEVKCYK